MPRALSIGNGEILVNLDKHGFVRDFYYPYVGHENHVGSNFVHRIGVFVDGKFSWLDDGSWEIAVRSEVSALMSNITAHSRTLNVRLRFSDVCYNEENILLRKVSVTNDAAQQRDIKIFFSQQFELYESHGAHTAYFDPVNKVIIHYRNRRAFLTNALLEGKPFDDFSTGVFMSEGKEGTFRDAEDGYLSKNPIEHGQADSVIGLTGKYESHEEKLLYYWITVGTSVREVTELNNTVLAKGPAHLLESTANFWTAWINRQPFNFERLDPSVIALFKKSLMYIRAHADSRGSIIASGDASMLQQGKDTYAYVWPRDGSFAALALAQVGDFNAAKRFFQFCTKTISQEGYFMHKYSPDGSLGSSWHAWVRNGAPQLPIQEDETASVLWAVWEYYIYSRDLEFIESIYNNVISKAADFLVLYRDEKTGLPKPSYDLWEEKFGVHTYTCAAVYGALVRAAQCAKLLGKLKGEHRYREAALEVRSAMLKYLYDEEHNRFYKSINFEDGQIVKDETIDISSVYGIFLYQVMDAGDPRLAAAFKQAAEELKVKTLVGGIARYKNDNYYRKNDSVPGNPWFVTSLWLAHYYIAAAKEPKDLEEVEGWLAWAVRHASTSGLMAEQLDPYTGEHLSASPLVWSHAELVRAVALYLDKLEDFGICKACNPVY